MARPATRRMTSLDAAFFYLERTGQLLHVGGVYTVEGRLDFDALRDDLSSRLHLIPRYTERAVPVPLNLAHPTWEPDPRFDIRRHVFRHTLRAPGDETQLVSLAGRLFGQPLDRERPLWELHQIDGYLGDRSALFAKVHHAMIDGVSGVQLLGVLFDPSPRPVPPPPPPEVCAVPRLPSGTTQLVRAVEEGVRDGVARARALLELLRDPVRAMDELRRAGEALGEVARIAAAGAPSMPFNGHVSILRRVVWTSFSLNEMKAVKNRLGGTVNDVVLASITTALRGYLEAHGVPTARLELRAMLPVNVRAAHEHLAFGNRVSALVAPLPVGLFDPHERYRQVQAATSQLKRRNQSALMTHALDLFDLVPPLLQKPLEWLPMVVPVNTVCTNIPGPPVSLYCQGRRLETLVPIVPLMQGIGIAFAILSYADAITIGITVDPALVPDAERFCDLLQAGFDELRTLAGVELARRPTPVRPERLRRRAEPSQVA